MSGQNESDRIQPAEPPKGAQPDRKTLWSWVAGSIALIVAVITALATLTDNLSKLVEAAKSRVRPWVVEDQLTLRDARRVQVTIFGTMGHWRHTTDWEVLVEAVVSKRHLKGCAADLDVNRRTTQNPHVHLAR